MAQPSLHQSPIISLFSQANFYFISSLGPHYLQGVLSDLLRLNYGCLVDDALVSEITSFTVSSTLGCDCLFSCVHSQLDLEIEGRTYLGATILLVVSTVCDLKQALEETLTKNEEVGLVLPQRESHNNGS